MTTVTQWVGGPMLVSEHRLAPGGSGPRSVSHRRQQLTAPLNAHSPGEERALGGIQTALLKCTYRLCVLGQVTLSTELQPLCLPRGVEGRGIVTNPRKAL